MFGPTGPEVLSLIDGQMAKARRRGEDRHPPLFCTNYPYWVNRARVDAIKLKLDYLDIGFGVKKNDEEAAAFETHVKLLYGISSSTNGSSSSSTSSSSMTGLWQSFKSIGYASSKEAKDAANAPTVRVAAQVGAHWNKLSPVDAALLVRAYKIEFTTTGYAVKILDITGGFHMGVDRLNVPAFNPLPLAPTSLAPVSSTILPAQTVFVSAAASAVAQSSTSNAMAEDFDLVGTSQVGSSIVTQNTKSNKRQLELSETLDDYDFESETQYPDVYKLARKNTDDRTHPGDDDEDEDIDGHNAHPPQQLPSSGPGHNTLFMRKAVAAHPVAKLDLVIAEPRKLTDTPTENNYFLCGSAFTIPNEPEIIANIDVTALPDFDIFLNLTKSKFLTLTAKPTEFVFGATPTSRLSSQDEWMQSLLANGLNIQTMAVSGTVTGSSALLARLDCSVQMQLATSQSTLTFSTAQTVFATSPSQVPETFASPLSACILKEYGILVMGLNSPRITLTTADLLTFLDLPWLAAAAGLPGFGLDLGFALDSDSFGSRSGMYFRPIDEYPTWLRLRFGLVGDGLNKLLGDVLPFLGSDVFDSTKTHLHVVRAARSFRGPQQLVSSITTTITFEIPIQTKDFSCTVWLTFGEYTTRLAITFQNATGDVIFDWISSALGVSQKPSDLLPSITHDFHVQSLSATLNTGGSSGKAFQLGEIKVILELDIFNTIFFVTLCWPNFRILAKLWTNIPPSMDNYNLLQVPWYELYDVPWPFGTPTGNMECSSLLSFASGDSSASITGAPAISLDTHIIGAEFEAWKDVDNRVAMRFSGSVGSSQPSNTNLPTLELGTLSLDASYLAAGNGLPASYEIIFKTSIYLLPRNFTINADNSTKYLPAQISARVVYKDGTWSISASVSDLQFALLYSMCDSDSSDAVMDIMEELSIPYLTIQYDKSASNTRLLIDGALRIHTLQLSLSHENNSNPKEWQFKAALGVINPSASGKNITIIDLIRDFDADSSIADALDQVPFVRDISVPTVTSAADAFENSPVQFMIRKTDDGVVVWFRIEIDSPAGNLSFLLVQWQSIGTNASPGGNAGASSGANDSQKPKPKRLIRVRIDHLPNLPDIPVVGSIGQPVDSIEYMFVQDSTAAAGATTAGFERSEIDQINNVSRNTQTPSTTWPLFGRTLTPLPGPSNRLLHKLQRCSIKRQ